MSESKYFELHDDLADVFKTAISKADLERFVKIKVLGCKNQKTLIKVSKVNELAKYKTTDDVDVTVNEIIFESLEKELQVMAVDEALAKIHFDAESGKVSIITPDINTFSLLLKKYGYEKYEVLTETVKSLYASKENEGELEQARVD